MFIILLILIFIRPFISSLAFPYLNLSYSVGLLGFLAIWFIIKKISLKKIQPLKYPVLLFCFALIISVAFSLNRTDSLKELYKYVTGILIFFVIAPLTYENRARIIRAMVLAGLVISLLSIYQYFFGFRHIIAYLSKEKIADAFVLDYVTRKRVFFPFVTPNTLAGYLAMIIPLALISKNRIWYIIPLSFALLLTKSLGALLSLFLALSLYFYLKGKFGKRKIIFLLGLLAIIGLVFISRASTQKQHLQPVFSTVMRLGYWKDTLKIIKARPLVGVGLGNFNLAQSRYAHNSYLQIWAEMGILGIISWLWIIFRFFNEGVKKIKFPAGQNYIIPAALSASVSFLIHNLIDFTFFLPEVSLIWWVILGL